MGQHRSTRCKQLNWISRLKGSIPNEVASPYHMTECPITFHPKLWLDRCQRFHRGGSKQRGYHACNPRDWCGISCISAGSKVYYDKTACLFVFDIIPSNHETSNHETTSGDCHADLAWDGTWCISALQSCFDAGDSCLDKDIGLRGRADN